MNSKENKICNNYALRKGPAHVFSPFSKLNDERRNSAKSFPPKVVRKRCLSPEVEVRPLGNRAIPVGKKGCLSPHYDKNSAAIYLRQLFTELETIGAGSYGSVHKYRSLEDGQCYAIKIIKRYCSLDRFGEVFNLDKITDNPYCIQYINAWYENGILYIQFELALTSLADYAKKNHNIKEAQCWDILFDIIQALIPLHAKGLCHMDIKPDNILITHDGKYKLCDFDLLTDVRDVDPDKFPLSEGDAKYIASEVLQGNFSPAGDIFSLGISILELSMDLLLPVFGPRWCNLRDSNWRLRHNNARAISFDLEGLLNWMMDTLPDQRPTSEQLLKAPMIMKLNRAKKPRFNHYADWCSQIEDEEVEVPVVPVVPISTPPSTPQNRRSTVYIERSSTYSTPARRVSPVKLRRSVLFFREVSEKLADLP